VKTIPHAARGNNTQARGILQIADVAKLRANETNFLEHHIALNKWTTPLRRWNRILRRILREKIVMDFK
jgi:hypothetical protein